MSAIQAAQVVVDYEPYPVPVLYAIEADAGEDLGWVLECRSDERGYGTPLLWYAAENAEAVIKEAAEESGCYGGQRVVGFTLTVRRDPPVRCDCCGKWGHAEADCQAASDRAHTCVNGGQS